MFTFFNKKLAVDTSSEEITRITTILKKNHIKYELRTTRTRGSIGSGLDTYSYAQANIALYKGASQPIFLYSVYVNRKDFNLARKLVWGS